MADVSLDFSAREPADRPGVAAAFPATGSLPITSGLPLLGGLGVRVGRATRADAGELLTLQRAAYVSEAVLHDDVRLPPLLQTLDELEAELLTPSLVALTALLGPRLVGSVRAGRSQADPAAWAIGRLVVAPDVQGRGIGGRLLAAIETAAPSDVRRYTLFTGHRSAANLAFYAHRGYRETHRESVAAGPDLVHLAKPRA